MRWTPLHSRAVGTALSVLGYGLLVALLFGGIQSGRFPLPSADVDNFLAAGARLRDGAAVYTGTWNGVGTVYFAPPLIVLFAIAGLLPSWVLGGGLILLDVIGLRYLTGSWRAFGWASLCPLTAFQLVSGNPNFAIVAATLAAVCGMTGPLAWAALAKIGPALSLGRRGVRIFAVSALVAALITAPWLGLWIDWVRFLLTTRGDPGWPIIVPFILRLPIAIALVASRRPSLRALAGAIAIPGFYIVTAWATIILIIRLLWAPPKEIAPSPPQPRGGDVQTRS